MFPAMFFPMIYGVAILKLIDIMTSKQLVAASGRPAWLLVMMGGPLITLVWVLICATRAMRYAKRFKQRKGMLCFVCDYDLIDGQSRCPECGSPWEPHKLGMKWKKYLG